MHLTRTRLAASVPADSKWRVHLFLDSPRFRGSKRPRLYCRGSRSTIGTRHRPAPFGRDMAIVNALVVGRLIREPLLQGLPLLRDHDIQRKCKESQQRQCRHSVLASHSALRNVKLMRHWPVSGSSPSASGATPWYARRSGPPQTTTSPLSSSMRRSRWLRLFPPNKNVAGRPSETETIGAFRSRSFSSRCSDSRAPGSYRLIRHASGSKPAKPAASAAAVARRLNDNGIGGQARPVIGSTVS